MTERNDIGFIVRDRLAYDPTTGEVTRKKPIHKWKAGPVGFYDRYGYLWTRVDKKLLSLHKIAWFLYYGHWPHGHIDHIDHDVTNNRINNLRVVTNAENQKNQRMRPNNTSGCTGVSWDKRSQKWAAYIRVGGKRKSLGYHVCFEEAAASREKALRKYGFHENHGKPDLEGPVTLPVVDV